MSRRLDPGRATSRLAGLCAAVVLLCAPACQFGGPVGGAPSAAPAAPPPLGSPEEEFPTTLAELRAFGRAQAVTWNDDPLLADATVWLSPSGRWERVRLSYVAAHADRLLTLLGDRESVRVQRPTLAGLGLLPLDETGAAALPPFPEDALEPVSLGEAAQPALADCGTPGTVRAVVYATGAPGSWDGQEWTLLPTWRATVVTPRGGVSVSPADGTAYAPLTCVEPLVLQAGG